MLSSIYEKCEEAYSIEKTVEVVVHIGGGSERIRIEVLRDLSDGHCCVKSYRQENVTLQPTYPQSGGNFDRSPEEFWVWVDFSLPWIHQREVDTALSQALSFLGERCDD